MGLFGMIVKGLWYSLFVLGVIIVGDYLVPGKIALTALTTMGVLIIFIAFVVDAIWLLSPVEKKPSKKDAKRLTP